jgi:hypothetical protein
VLIADVARQFFNDLYTPIDGVAALRNKDDLKIILFNRVIDLARDGMLGRIRTVCRGEGLTPCTTKPAKNSQPICSESWRVS